MRIMAARQYGKISLQYWVTFGLPENETRLPYRQKFLDMLKLGGWILSAGGDTGSCDGLVLEAGALQMIFTHQRECRSGLKNTSLWYTRENWPARNQVP